MGWIESYKSQGQRYYRYRVKGENPVHLGTAEAILRKVKGGAEEKRVATHEVSKGE